MNWLRRIISCASLVLVATTFASAAPSNLAVGVEPTISPTPVKANGAFHAVYELRISNYSRHQLHLHEIAVTGVSGQRVLAQYDGQSLIDALNRPGAPADITDKRALAAGMSAVGRSVFLTQRPDASPPCEIRANPPAAAAGRSRSSPGSWGGSRRRPHPSRRARAACAPCAHPVGSPSFNASWPLTKTSMTPVAYCIGFA